MTSIYINGRQIYSGYEWIIYYMITIEDSMKWLYQKNKHGIIKTKFWCLAINKVGVRSTYTLPSPNPTYGSILGMLILDT